MIPPYTPPICDCSPACENCGYPESAHPVDESYIVCDQFVPGPLPPTHYRETRRETYLDPAEGIEVCELCGRERS